jgi:hypothetical protein
VVESVTWASWSDLRLAWEDTARLDAANQLARRLGEVVPLSRTEVADAEVLRTQIEVRFELWQMTQGQQRQDIERDLRLLLSEVDASHAGNDDLERLKAHVEQALRAASAPSKTDSRQGAVSSKRMAIR